MEFQPTHSVLIKADAQAAPSETHGKLFAQGQQLISHLFSAVNDVDLDAARIRVAHLRQKHPDDSPDALIQRLINNKSAKTATIGIVTSWADLIPAIGTAVGVAAEVKATFKEHADLVVEIALAHNYPLTEAEKKQAVMLVTGLATGSETAADDVAKAEGHHITEEITETFVLDSIPIIGGIASAGTNVVETYVIGQRADIYFRHGPQAMGSWVDSFRTVNEGDQQTILGWLAQTRYGIRTKAKSGAGQVGTVVQTGLRQVGAGVKTATIRLHDVGQSAGQVIAGGMSRSYDKLVGRNLSKADGEDSKE